MSWVEAIVSNIRALIKFLLPFFVVRSYERGVVFRFGVVHRTAEPGLRWKWPVNVEMVEIVHVTPDTKNLLSQTVTTMDGVAVTFSTNIVYEITDAALMYTAVQDFETSLEAAAMIHLSRRIREATWQDLLAGQKKLEDSLASTLTTRVKKWGATILDVGITDFTKAKPFRLFSDPGTRGRSAGDF